MTSFMRVDLCSAPQGARLQRPGDLHLPGDDAQDQHGAARVGGAQVPDQLYPLAVGEVQVHDRHVHGARPGGRDGPQSFPDLGEGVRLRDHGEVRFPLDHKRERFQKGSMVVDEHDPHRGALFTRVAHPISADPEPTRSREEARGEGPGL